tara:strand:- start:24180 stop:27017 length:2838 start_codon:yes stop_codon:yes gene_type:complete
VKKLARAFFQSNHPLFLPVMARGILVPKESVVEDLVFGFIVKLVDNATSNAAKIRKEIDLLSTSIDKMSRRDKKLKPQGIERFAQNAKGASRSARQFTSSSGQLSASLSRLTRRTRSASTSMSALRNVLIGITAARVFSGIRRGIRGISSGLMDVIKTGADFDKQLTFAAGVMGAKSEGVARLRAEAKRLGATTSFAARDAARGFKILGQAGLGIDASISVLGPALKFAGGAMLTLEKSTQMVTDTVNVFGLKASEAKSVTDVLTAGMNAANTSAVELKDALRQAGPVAAATGRSLKETVTVLALFAKGGFRGQAGGIGLRNVLASIQTPSKNLTRSLSFLNLSMADLNPKTNGLITIFQRLAPLTRRQDLVFKLFGKRTGPAFNAIIKAIGKSLGEVQGKMAGAMTTAELYEKMMNTVAGRMDIFKSAVEALKIELFDAIKPKVKQDLSDMASLVNGIMRAVKRGAPVVRATFGLIGSVFRFTLKVMQFSLGGIGRAFETLSKKGKMSKEAIKNVLGPLLLGVALIEIEVLNFIEGLVVGLRKGFSTAKNIIFPFIGVVFKVGMAVGEMIGFFSKGGRQARKFGEAIGAVIGIFGAFALAKISLMIPQFIIGTTTAFVLGVQRIATTLFTFLIPAQTAATASTTGLNVAMYANPIGLVVAGIVALVGVVFLAIRYWDTWTGWMKRSGIWLDLLILSLSFLGLGFLRIPLLIVTYWNPLKAFFSTLWREFKMEASAVINWFVSKWKWMTSTVTMLWRAAGVLVKALWQDIRDSVLWVWRGFMGYLDAALQRLKRVPIIGKAVQAFITARNKDVSDARQSSKPTKPMLSFADRFIASRKRAQQSFSTSKMPSVPKRFMNPALKQSAVAPKASDLGQTALSQAGTQKQMASQSRQVQGSAAKKMLIFKFEEGAINIETQIKDAEELARELLPALKRVVEDAELRGAN